MAASQRNMVKVLSKPVGPSRVWPMRRSGHRVVSLGNNVYVFGGYAVLPEEDRHILFKEVWKYNMAAETWTQMTLKQIPFPTSVASSTAATIGRYLLAFGGTGYPFGDEPSNKLYVIDLINDFIKLQETTGVAPIPSYGHACAVDEVNKKMYIVGGTSGNTFFSEVYCLDLTTKIWKEIKCFNNECMHPRYRSEIALHDDKIFVFGGGTIHETFDLMHIPCLDLKTRRWELLAATGYKVRNSKKFPARRKCHSGVFIPGTEFSDPKFIIAGGLKNDTQLDDIWAINLITLQWSKFKARLPKRILFHDATVTKSGHMVIFGGLTSDKYGFDKRVNEIVICRVALPELKELAWEAVLNFFPYIKKMQLKDLRKSGVPSEFFSRFL